MIMNGQQITKRRTATSSSPPDLLLAPRKPTQDDVEDPSFLAAGVSFSFISFIKVNSLRLMAFVSSNRTLRRRRRTFLLAALILIILLLYGVLTRGWEALQAYWRIPRYESTSQADLRLYRFPTVDQRVRAYMSYWYVPPCSPAAKIRYRTIPWPQLSSSSSVSSSSSAAAAAASGSWYHDPWADRNTPTSTGIPVGEHNETVLRGPFWYQITEAAGSPPPHRILVVDGQVRVDHMFFMETDQLYLCYQRKNWSIRYYCRDAARSIYPALHRIGWWWNSSSSWTTSWWWWWWHFSSTLLPWSFWSSPSLSGTVPPPPPVLLQFGDHSASVGVEQQEAGGDSPSAATYREAKHLHLPHFKKFRAALTTSERDAITLPSCYNSYPDDQAPATATDDAVFAVAASMPPIVWNLNVRRHYGYLDFIKEWDTPWELKKDAAIFRGMLTGKETDGLDLSDEEKCRLLPRCRLVLNSLLGASGTSGGLAPPGSSAASTPLSTPLVDALLTSTLNKIPDVIAGVNVTGDVLFREELLKYKGIIILEGNDVSSGLKWAMMSSSVVLMPPPTKSSWAMEDLLEPWMHYIPLLPDLSNVAEQVQWMLQHPSEARRIAHRARLWIMDLVYHPDSARDDQAIQEEILRRYRAHFLYEPD